MPVGVVEEILHMLPALKELKLLFIGSELPADQIDECRALEDSGINVINCCQKCTSTKRRITLSLWEGLYHDYLSTSCYTQPDLAVAFNPGWTYVKTTAGWLPMVARLAEAAHATLFTSFNQAEIDKEIFQINVRFPNVRFIPKADVNKWKAMSANLTPLFMPETPPTKENRFLTKNRYWYVFTGSRGSVLA